MPYLNVEEIESAVIALAATYPGTCELITLPNLTVDGRTTNAMRIALGAEDDRPAVFFVGGQHPAEWGSGDICISFATDLLEAYAANTGLTYGSQTYPASVVRRVMEECQTFIYPCVNPDGKNLSQSNPDVFQRHNSNGVDLNRNYDAHWLDIPAHGTAPFSEPETQNVRFIFDSYPQIRWCIDIHCYTQLLYHNWGIDQNQITTPAQNFLNPVFDGMRGIEDDGYSEYIRPEDLGTQCGLVERMQSSLNAVRGITYSTGQSFDLYVTRGTLTDYAYARHWADPSKTKTQGFLIEWGTEFQPPFAEMENIILDISSALLGFTDHALDECGILDIELETMSLEFASVPEGQTTYRAVTFRTTACCSLDFEIVDGPSVTSGPAGTEFLTTLLGTSDTAPAAPDSFSHAHLWISYTGTAAGDTAEGTVTVRCHQTNQEWDVDITADVIERPSAAVMMVLDQSGSMRLDSGIGPGISREDVLKFSAPPVVEVIEDGNLLGILQFDHDPHPIMGLTEMDVTSRGVANDHFEDYAHNPGARTSIGEAVVAAQDLLSDDSVTQDVKAMIVLTDGREEHGSFDRRFISEVGGSINSNVFAIGLGTPDNLQPAALEALCAGNMGYMMMTGPLDADASFRLTKYYQQILAGVTNNDIIVDPDGRIKPGQRHEIPFRISETDITGDVLLLSPAPGVFKFSLITPSGEIIDPGVAAASPAIDLGGGEQVRFYRMQLPVVLGGAGDHEGVWRAVLEIDRKQLEKYFVTLKQRADSVDFKDVERIIKEIVTHGMRYSVMSRTWSNLNMSASKSQTSFEPGAMMTLRAKLTEYSVPVEDRANVVAEMTAPDGALSVLQFYETHPGIFEAETDLMHTGVTSFRIMAKGKTLRGTPFTREQTLTGSVWHGGDRPPPSGSNTGTGTGTGSGLDLCCLINCFSQTDSGQRFLKKHEIDICELQKCLKECCG